MFFLGLTISFILVGAGIVLLIKSSYLTGGILLAVGLLFFMLFARYYRSRKKRRKGELNSGFDCSPDCSGIPIKKIDCDCGKGDGLDCDGTPDCDCSPDCSL